jgi:hypothetical protein
MLGVPARLPAGTSFAFLTVRMPGSAIDVIIRYHII